MKRQSTLLFLLVCFGMNSFAGDNSSDPAVCNRTSPGSNVCTCENSQDCEITGTTGEEMEKPGDAAALLMQCLDKDNDTYIRPQSVTISCYTTKSSKYPSSENVQPFSGTGCVSDDNGNPAFKVEMNFNNNATGEADMYVYQITCPTDGTSPQSIATYLNTSCNYNRDTTTNPFYTSCGD